MFIYQTKKLYNEDGDGPFDALVITNGEQGAKPAEVGDTVIALTQETEIDSDVTLHNILYYNEFVVGEKPVPYIELYYDGNIIENGSTLDLTQIPDVLLNQANIDIKTNLSIDKLSATSSNDLIVVSDFSEGLDDFVASVLISCSTTSSETQESIITIKSDSSSVSFTIVMLNGEE